MASLQISTMTCDVHPEEEQEGDLERVCDVPSSSSQVEARLGPILWTSGVKFTVVSTTCQRPKAFSQASWGTSDGHGRLSDPPIEKVIQSVKKPLEACQTPK